ncbi:hypothetical protein [Flavobacterium sp. Sr18]|nr:hypothetical protein [Flavobacterium sp. Sr18]
MKTFYVNNSNVFSHDSSGNPRNLESDFFLAGKERPTEAPFVG